MSNDNTAKPTAGPWRIDPTDDICVLTSALVAGDIVCLSPAESGFSESAKKWAANAELIAEAGTVYHETGLTPRQLLDKLTAAEESDADSLRMYRSARDRADQLAEQRDELLAKLRGLIVMVDDDIVRVRPSDRGPFLDWLADANDLIAKVEAKP